MLHIPLQERPVYAKADYGKIKKNVVYLRRGSSTGEATPEEIKRMGLAAVGVPAAPSAALHVVDRQSGQTLPQPVRAERPTWIEMPSTNALPDYLRPFGNREYYREVAAYWQVQACLPLALELENTGGVVIRDAKLRIEVPDPDKRHELRGPGTLPDQPVRQAIELIARGIEPPWLNHDVTVTREGGVWKVECDFGKVQPRSMRRLSDDLLIGARRPSNLDLCGKIYGDNISTPIAVEFRVSFSTGSRHLDPVEVVRIADGSK